MNKIFKVVWSKVKHCYVVVSEIAKNTTSGGARRCRMGKVSLAAAMAAAVLTGSFAMPNSALAADGQATYDLYAAYRLQSWLENQMKMPADCHEEYVYEDNGTYKVATDERGLVGNRFDGYRVYYVKNGYSITRLNEKGDVVEVSGSPASENVKVLAATQTRVENIGDNNQPVTTRRGDLLTVNIAQSFASATNGGNTSPPAQLKQSGGTENNLYGYRIYNSSGVLVTDAQNEQDSSNGRLVKLAKENGKYYYVKDKNTKIEVATKNVYFLKDFYGENDPNANNYEVQAYTFLNDLGEVYNGVVYGVNSERLATTKTEDGTIYTFWAVEASDEYTTLDKMTVNALNESFNTIAEDLVALQKADFNSISLTPASDNSPNNVIYFKDFAGDTIDSINVSVTGGTSTSPGNRKVLFSSSSGDEHFELETGSIVSALVNEPTSSTEIKGISINGVEYKIASNTATDTMSSWKAIVGGATATISNGDGLAFKAGSNVSLGLEDKTITINATDYHLVGATEKNEDGKDTYSGEYSVDTNGKLVLNVQNGTDPVAEEDKITITGLATKSDINNIGSNITELQNRTFGVTANGDNNTRIGLYKPADNSGDKAVLSDIAVSSIGGDGGNDVQIKFGGDDGFALTTGSIVRANDEAIGTNEGALYKLAINGEVYNVATSDSVTSSAAAAKTELKNGVNTTISSEIAEDEHTIYAVNLNDIINLTDDGSLNVGSTVKVKVTGIEMGNQKITGLAAGEDDDDAVNFGQLKSYVTGVDKYLVSNPANDGKYTVDNNSVTLKVKNGKNDNGADTYADVVIDGIASKTELDTLAGKIGDISDIENNDLTTNTVVNHINNLYTKVESAAGEASKKTTVTGSGNITVTQAADSSKANEYNVALNNDITLTTKDTNDNTVIGQVAIKSSDSTVIVGIADSGNEVVINGANGTVNVGEKVSIDGANGTITAGDSNGTNVSINATTGNIVATTKTGDNVTGQVTIDSANNKVTVGVGGDENAQVVINGANGTITGLTNTTWNGTTDDASRAATEGQLQSAVTQVKQYVSANDKHIDYNKTYAVANDKITLDVTNSNSETVVINDVASAAALRNEVAERKEADEALGRVNARQDSQIASLQAVNLRQDEQISNLQFVNDGQDTQIARIQENVAQEIIDRQNNDIVSGNIADDGKVTLTKGNGDTISVGVVQDYSLNGVSFDADKGEMTFKVKNHYSTDEKDVKVSDVASKTALDKEIERSVAVDQAIIKYTENQTNRLDSRINQLGSKVNKVGAGAAALAALHPMDFDPDDKLSFAVGAGNYAGETATALGAFYRPNEKVMMNVAGTYGNGENMVNMGVSFALDRTNNISNSRTAMAREIVDLREQVATQGQQIAQLVALVNQLSGIKEPVAPTVQPFPDVPANHWAYEYLNNLVTMGVIEGYPDGTFGGDRTMTRYEFATMLFKAMQNGAVLSEQIRQEFNAELGRIRVDRIKGADDDANKIERVRVNNYEDRDDYGSKIVMVSASK